MSADVTPLVTGEMINSPDMLRAVREVGGVQHVDMGGREFGWLVTEYDAAWRTLADPRMVGQPLQSLYSQERTEDDLPDEEDLFFLPEDENTRVRRMITRQLNHRRVIELAPRIQLEVDALLDAMEPGQPQDFVEAFARPLPVAMLCELLGIPRSDRQYIREYIYGWVVHDSESASITKDAGLVMADYLRSHIADRRAANGDDMLSAILRDGGTELSERDVLTAVRMLLVGGNRPVTRLLSDGLQVLHQPRSHWECLVNDPARIEPTIEELLRFITPSSLSTRYAKSDVAVDGVEVPPGGGVHCALVAINRDPAKFPDPDTFDPQRVPNPHLAFGLGRKHCLGASLARAEARIALGTLVRRFPRMRVVKDSNVRGIPVVLDPAL